MRPRIVIVYQGERPWLRGFLVALREKPFFMGVKTSSSHFSFRFLFRPFVSLGFLVELSQRLRPGVPRVALCAQACGPLDQNR